MDTEKQLQDARNLTDRLANALLSEDPMEKITALAEYAADIENEREAEDVCRIGGVPREYLDRARRVRAKVAALAND